MSILLLAVLLVRAQTVIGGTWTWEPPDPATLPPEVTRTTGNGGPVQFIQNGSEIELRTSKASLGKGTISGPRVTLSRPYPDVPLGAPGLVIFQWEPNSKHLMWEFDLRLADAATLEGTLYVTKAVPQPGGRVVLMKERYHAIPVRFRRPVTTAPPIANDPAPHDDPPTVEILDIHPIQVVQEPFYEARREDIPMVVGRKTAVRVFVKLPPGKRAMDEVTCTLNWGNQTDQLVCDLRDTNARTWAFPVGSPLASHWKNVMEGAPGAKRSKATLAKEGDRYFAYNFTFGQGRECPAKSLTLTATLTDKAGKVLSKMTESSGTDFFLCDCKHNFKMLVLLAETRDGRFKIKGKKGPFDLAVAQELLRQAAAASKQSVLAVFPIPEANFQLETVVPPPDPGNPTRALIHYLEAADYISQRGSFTDILERGSRYNATVVVTGQDFNVGRVFGPKKPEGWTPVDNDRVHFVSPQNPSITTLVVAHEIGHDSLFFGNGHPTGGQIQDAWDAGGYKNSTFNSESRTMAGCGWLMQQAEEGSSESVNNFISAEEYKTLLKVFTNW